MAHDIHEQHRLWDRRCRRKRRMNDTQARARVWTLCLAALVLCALTGPVVGLLTPLAQAPAPALSIVAAVLVGAYVALAALLIVAVLRVVRPRLDGRP